MKQLSGTLRLDLAQYRAMAAFAQFASDLDARTRAQLERGARLVEILKQGQYVPQPVEKQIVILFAGTQGLLDDLPVSVLGRFEQELYAHLEAKDATVFSDILAKKALDDELKAKIRKAIEAFKKRFILDPSKGSFAAAAADSDDEDDEEEEAPKVVAPKKAKKSKKGE